MAAIAGLVEAIERFVPTPVFEKSRLELLNSRLSSLDEIDGINLLCPSAKRLANTASFTVPGIDSITQLAALDLDGICASAGSACSAGSLNPSHVLSAMGKSDNEANSLVRFSLGRETTEEEINFVLSSFHNFIEANR